MAMVAKRVETASGDLISSLPDEVLGQILSLLPTKIAASTSLLSKRWRNLLSLVHSLDFDDSMVFHPNRRSETRDHVFVDFVKRTLLLLGDSPIEKFSFKFKSRFCVDHLVYSVLEREVLELNLSAPYNKLVFAKLYFSKTLVKLTLTNGLYPCRSVLLPPGGVLFPALKSLSIFSVTFLASELLYDCLLASPVLEEINICDDHPLRSRWAKRVWGSSIDRLTIFYRSVCLDDHSCFTIKTPSLVFFDYSSYVAKDYVVQMDSLVQARLDLRLWKYYSDDYVPTFVYSFGYNPARDGDWGDATKLIAAIRNVVTLHLSANSLEVFYFCSKSMPEFNNLVNLSFESQKARSWQVLPLLLQKSPYLETLVIKGLVHKITDQCGDVCVCVHKNMTSCSLLSCGVKVLKIYEYKGNDREVKQMRHFIENLWCLEVVKVKVHLDVQDQYLPLKNELMKLIPTAASSKCTIQCI